jgi:Lrp/AsnC family transcriptional regulator, leucine-responsive regulatory protein
MPKSDNNRSLDRIDRAILRTLQEDGRISNVELAKRINLSPSPCLERVRRLETEGYIEGYHARLNASKLNRGTTAFVEVTLNRTTSDVFDHFRNAVVEIKDVAECHMVAGGFDYLVKLRITSMEDYREVLTRLVDLPGVSQTHTYMVIEHVKEDEGVAVE